MGIMQFPDLHTVFLLGGTKSRRQAAGRPHGFPALLGGHFRMGYASSIAWLLFILFGSHIEFRLAGRWVYYEDEAANR